MEQAPNSTPAPAPANEPAAPSMPMGTTPTGRQAAAAPTSEPAKPAGTEGKPAPAADPNKPAAGDDTEDYKTKFSESSKEALRLLDILKAKGIDPATGEPIAAPASTPAAPAPAAPTEPSSRTALPPQPEVPLTDEQLTKAIPGFANLSEEEKSLIRDTKATVKQIAEMRNLVSELYDDREYAKQFKSLSKKDEWKQLAEHAEEFKDFAYEKDNLAIPLETLAATFLYKKGLTAKPADKPQPTGIEPGSGGGKPAGKETTDEGYTAEEAATIRTTDPKRYNKLVQSGKLKIRTA